VSQQTTNYDLTYPESTDNVRLWEHIQQLAEDADDGLTTIHDEVVASACPKSAGISVAASGNENTVSSSYANLGATSSFSFVKEYTSTKIKIEMSASAQTNGLATGVRYGVLINGTDYDVCQMVYPSSTVRFLAAGVAVVTSGLAAGTYTIQARWKRVSGSATVQRFITDDWLSVCATEVKA
jgi:hypothetical protein